MIGVCNIDKLVNVAKLEMFDKYSPFGRITDSPNNAPRV